MKGHHSACGSALKALWARTRTERKGAACSSKLSFGVHTYICLCSWLYTCSRFSASAHRGLRVGVCLCGCVWQRAGQGVYSWWFMAAEVWLHWCDWRGEQTGGSIRLLCGRLHRHAHTRRIETTQPETLGLPPGDLTEKQPHCGFAQEYTSDSWLIWMFCVFLMNLIIVEAESAGRCLMGSCVIKVFILKLSRREKSVLLLKPLICEVMDVFTSVSWSPLVVNLSPVHQLEHE